MANQWETDYLPYLVNDWDEASQALTTQNLAKAAAIVDLTNVALLAVTQGFDLNTALKTVGTNDDMEDVDCVNNEVADAIKAGAGETKFNEAGLYLFGQKGKIMRQFKSHDGVHLYTTKGGGFMCTKTNMTACILWYDEGQKDSNGKGQNKLAAADLLLKTAKFMKSIGA